MHIKPTMTCSNNGCNCVVKEQCQIRIKCALKGYSSRTCIKCSALPTSSTYTSGNSSPTSFERIPFNPMKKNFIMVNQLQSVIKSIINKLPCGIGTVTSKTTIPELHIQNRFKKNKILCRDMFYFCLCAWPHFDMYLSNTMIFFGIFVPSYESVNVICSEN